MAARGHWRRALIGALVLVALVAAIVVVMSRREERYVEFASPDGRFKIVVNRRPSLFGVAPGQSGDAPGRALLVDRSGHVLREEPLEMVQLVETPQWRTGAVEVRPFGEWSLPP
jgi:hypothetical protein